MHLSEVFFFLEGVFGFYLMFHRLTCEKGKTQLVLPNFTRQSIHVQPPHGHTHFLKTE